MKVVLKKREDKKKVWALAGLGVIAAVLLYYNVLAPDSATSTPANPATGVNPAAPAASVTPVSARRRGAATRREWIPTQGGKRPEDRVDPAKVDPALRLDLLAKVQNVPLEGGSRNLFQFGVAPPPPDTTPIPKVPKIPINKQPAAVAPPPPGPPPVPPPPPIPLKYYGYSNARGDARKKAFFLDGDDIIVAWEGETVKSRYKVVRVGVNSVEMEDTQSNSKQTLPLVEEAVG